MTDIREEMTEQLHSLVKPCLGGRNHQANALASVICGVRSKEQVAKDLVTAALWHVLCADEGHKARHLHGSTLCTINDTAWLTELKRDWSVSAQQRLCSSVHGHPLHGVHRV